MDDIPAAEFDGRDFDAREVVQRYRKRVPLPQLQKSLRAHFGATRMELVELINDKYADFVSLSSRMQGVERALRPLRAPLEESSELTRGLHSRLGTILAQAEDAHKQLADIQSRKDALATYIKNAKLLDKAKNAVSQNRANPQESDDLTREHITQENVARDLRRIRLNLGGFAPKPPEPGPTPAAAIGTPSMAVNTLQAATKATTSSTAAASPEDAEETPAEWKQLLAEATEFEETFAAGLREKLMCVVGAAKRMWERPREGDPQTGGGDTGNDQPLPRAELLSISHVCRALVTLGRSHMVDAVFVEVFVRETLDAATAVCNKSVEDSQGRSAGVDVGGAGASGISSMGAMDLRPFFDAVRAALLLDGSPLLWIARRLHGAGDEGEGDDVGDTDDALLAVPSLHLVANAIVVSVLQHVQRVWPIIFMPAFPDMFAANHAHASTFICDAQALMAPQELRAFVQGPALADFQKRWKTQVYASLRAKEATQRIEAAGKAAFDGVARCSACGHEFWMEVSAELVRTLQVVWSSKWYLETLYPKMSQLTLELLARYGRMVRGLADGAADSSLTGAWDANTGVWSSSSLPARLACAGADVLEVLAEIACGDGSHSLEGDGATARMMLGHAPGGSEGQAVALARALLREADAALRPAIDVLGDVALKQVAAAAAPQYAAIRGIPTRFRMLNKPLPTKASPYVESILRPAQALRESAVRIASRLQDWARKAVDEAALEFASQAAQLLESTRQQEASLRRLVAGRGNTDGEAQVSDLDKIHVQLCLDVDTFIQAAAELGATASDPGIAKLSASVESVWPTYRTHRPGGIAA